MNLIKKIVSSFGGSKYNDFPEFNKSNYLDYPEQYKPYIDAQYSVYCLGFEASDLFNTQKEASPEQGQKIQYQIIRINNRIRVFLIIQERQDDIRNIQRHYEEIDNKDFFDSL